VTDTPIVSNPLNPKQLLLGTADGNCPIPSVLVFHLSNDGGSTWKLKCMTSIITQGHVYWPSFDPSVGYDRKGTAISRDSTTPAIAQMAVSPFKNQSTELTRASGRRHACNRRHSAAMDMAHGGYEPEQPLGE